MNSVTLKIKRATVLVSQGPDRITLTVELPSPFPSCDYDATIGMDTAPSIGAQYCLDNFGISPEVVNIRR